MSIQTLKTFRIGQIVRVLGREGVIVNSAGEEVKIKFTDGTFGFFSINEVESSIENTSLDSRLKSFYKSSFKVCPFCKGEARKVGMDFEQKETGAYQCMKCSQRFVSEKPNEKSNEFKGIMRSDESSIHITM